MKAEDELRPGFLRDTFEGEDATPPTDGYDRLMADLGARRRRRPFTWIWIPALLLSAGGAWYALRGDQQALTTLAVNQPAASEQAQATTQTSAAEAGSKARTAARSKVAQSPTVTGQQAQTIASQSGSESAVSDDATTTSENTVAEASSATAGHILTVPTVPADAADQPTASAETEQSEENAVRTRRGGRAVTTPVVQASAATRRRIPYSGRTPGENATPSNESARNLHGAQDNLVQADEQARKALEGNRISGQPQTEQPVAATDNVGIRTPIAPAPAIDSSAKSQLPLAKIDSVARPTTVTPVDKGKTKLLHRWEKALYAGLMFRRRDAVLVQSEEGERMNWSASQGYQIPGLEVGGALNYRVIRNLSFGASLGMGLWKENLDITSQTQQSQPTIAFNRSTNAYDAYDVSPAYNEVQSGSLSWMVWQAHSSAYLRIGDPVLPFTAQAGPTLDAVHAFAGKSTGPSRLAPALLPGQSTHFVPGVEAKFRFKPHPANPRGWAYEISGRNHFKPAFDNAGLFKLQYGMVTIGASFVW